ncbi:hypothetical protein ACIBI8_11400 [Streptomyces sp. NPDC050529]|uniref:hypothetical protein n=1 Tax=unclassified Streptomyces TaxID=2593676 RepID=UPI002DD9E78A|nr:hypothetical protein [Streptomyces sp. NBC_01022]WRZ79029.1 hypothetical protein OG316_01495 [Streptomyces sp. NBC_01022]WRZ86650.1 hypothetical protein OG316_43400 [Streptomyces sp. NBC_01022]
MGSRDADIDFSFTRSTTVRAVLDALTPMGWTAVEPAGHVAYMVNDEDESYEWYDSTPERIGEVLEVLDATANLPYTVALNVYHAEAKTGGMLMFHAHRADVSFVPSIDRRRVPSAPEFTDLAWYLNALVPALVTAGLREYEAREVRY